MNGEASLARNGWLAIIRAKIPLVEKQNRAHATRLHTMGPGRGEESVMPYRL